MSSMARTALVAALLVGTVGYSEGFALGGTPALVGGKLRHVLYRPRSMRGMLRGLRAQVQPGTSTDEASAGLVQREIIGTPMKGPASNPHELSVQQKVYLWLTTLFVACLLIADVIGVKLFNIPLPITLFGMDHVEHTCGMITFPITFILGDIINEYYGKAAAKQTVYAGLAMSILAFAVINVAQYLPPLDAPYNVSQASFDMIFGSSKMLYIASLIAYVIGNLCDIWLFGIIKKATNGKLLWLRATGSTVISQMLDSLAVTYLAFGIGKTMTGQVGATGPEVLQIAATGYILKFTLAILVTPVIYLSRDFLHNKFGLDPIPPDVAEEN